MRVRTLAILIAVLPALAGCHGNQSVFVALGPVASRINLLMWIMFGGAVLILALIIFFSAAAITGLPGWQRKLSAEKSIILGGIAFPCVVLTALLVYGLLVLKSGETLVHPGEEPVRISVTGEQWWWRVFYRHKDGHVTESANELRIPVGRVIEVQLSAADVIHSFWIPAYAGKVDMIPGRVNKLHFIASTPGIVRGQCAEYCGGAHALMALYAVAMAPADYEAWLAGERLDAKPADSEGCQLFLGSGCGACHAIRGTGAKGGIGPDLTHVGSRLSLGAGILPAGKNNLYKWLSRHRKIKPDNLMPAFDFLSEREFRLLAEFLESLK